MGTNKNLSFREFLESPRWLGVQLSPLIAAIADASDGKPVHLDESLCARAFGCPAEQIPHKAYRTVVVRAGGRGGKTSRLLAPKALHAAVTVPLPHLRRGEIAASALIAPDLGLAHQALSFVIGYVEESPLLAKMLVERTQNYVSLRRPDGKVVRIQVFAASRGGRASRGRSTVFCGMDESSFFRDTTSGVINDRDIYNGITQRIVDDGSTWIASTPWIKGVGLLEEKFAQDYGVHASALCVRGTTRELNPSWDPSGEIERDLREQDPISASREIDAEPLDGDTASFFDPTAIDSAVEDTLYQSAPKVQNARYMMGADLAFRRDGSAAVVVEIKDKRFRIVDLTTLAPRKGQALTPSQVCTAFADVAKRYGVTEIHSDGHYSESAKELLKPHGIRLTIVAQTAEGKERQYTTVRDLFHEGKVRIPNNAPLVRQLKEVVAKPRVGGGLQIASPRRLGSHGDLVSAAVLALWAAGSRAAPIILPPGFGQVRSCSELQNPPHAFDENPPTIDGRTLDVYGTFQAQAYLNQLLQKLPHSVSAVIADRIGS